MDSDMSKVNHLESDVLLPPRKRLLAGFKKQISEGNGSSSSSGMASSSNASPATSSDAQTQVDNLLASRLNDPNLTPEEIAEASRAAAVEATKKAKAARAVANEKTEIAAKAVAAAKTAISLAENCTKEAVELVYSRDDKLGELREAVDELAIRLDRIVNRSNIVLKSCSGSELKDPKHKKQEDLKISDSPDRRGNGIDNLDSRSNQCKEKTGVDSNFPGTKRARVTIKKLPVIECSSKEESSSPSAEKGSGDKPLVRQAGTTDSVVAASKWKSKDSQS